MEFRSPIWKIVWTTNMMPKGKYFIWRLVWGILPIVDNLLRRRLNVDSVCQICFEQNESIFHVMFDYRLSKQVWTGSCLWVLEVMEDILTEENVFEKLFIKAF